MPSLEALGERTKGQVQRSFLEDSRRATSGFGGGDVRLVAAAGLGDEGVDAALERFDAGKEGKKKNPTAEKTVCY